MILRRANDRFETNLGWLQSHHTFAFGGHRDPNWLGFRALRVINDDTVAASAGFGEHGHRDMEILSWVRSGTLRHQDSLGNGSDIVAGDIQRMSAGTGVLHSELNPSATEPVRFLQIWIEPDARGIDPGYEQRRVPLRPGNGWQLLASGDGRGEGVSVNATVELHGARLGQGERLDASPDPGRGLWLHVVSGRVHVNGFQLSEGDGLGAEPGEIDHLTVTDASEDETEPTELLLFLLS